MMQVMRAAFRDAGDKSQLSLIFANQSPEDILLREELEQEAKVGRCSLTPLSPRA